ncbi:long-chain fatty acid--CoA ligase [soil metagenome]
MQALQRLRLITGRDHTLGTLMERLAEVHGDRRLVQESDDGLCLTYRQAAKRVARWAGGIAERIEPGDNVVVATANGYEQLLLCLAASRAGGVPAPVNDQMRTEEIARVVEDSGATLVVRAAIEVDGADPLAVSVPADPDATAALFYTSGTTGRPKGVELTHRGLVGSLARAAAWPNWARRDEAVLGLPVAHIMGFAALAGLACAGIPFYLLTRFNPVRVLDAIEGRRATIFIGVPAMYRMLLEAGASERDLRSIRVWGSGADAMPAELASRFKSLGATARLPFVGARGEAMFVEGYGMVELGGAAAGKISPPFLDAGLGDSLGWMLPGYRTRVVDDDGEEAPTGSVGELWLQGPGVTSGYHNDADATAEAMSDGWLRTGDLVRKGPFGLVMFAGRQKDVIKRGGYSVYAVEVERALEEHPSVLEAAVLGLPDERSGEVPVAAVRLVGGADLDELALDRWAAERLSTYKVPTRFVAIDELPRTATNKVAKQELRPLF